MYTPLEDRSEQDSQPSEDYDSLLSKESQDSNSSFRPSSARDRNQILVQVFLTLLLSIFAFVLGSWLGRYEFSNPSGRDYLEHVQKYSPILKDVDTSIQYVTFNGSFMKENAFRQGAGPEVDLAWESMGVNYRSLAIPVSEAAASGLKPDQVQIKPKYGGGFPGNVEGLHHLHCLNLLRQSLYFNYDYYKSKGEGAFTNDDSIVHYHVTHCMDIIRQQLMCMPDTGILGQVWWDPAAPKAFVDFNTEHKCKNFDAIRQWAQDRQIPEQVADDFLQPPKEGDTIYEEIP
ncbi:Oxidase ustYa [Lachnellula cervina]|uniref:Oxidase ustYa n=1 Tax=Lachnellula cervina TaxID=1316786 RepID=A0A7D8UMX2_9HELO|nr:Oxidase ustYa [Lachnellula cervina]